MLSLKQQINTYTTTITQIHTDTNAAKRVFTFIPILVHSNILTHISYTDIFNNVQTIILSYRFVILQHSHNNGDHKDNNDPLIDHIC